MKPLLILFSLLALHAQGQIITTFAGSGSTGFSGDGGPASAAQMSGPYGLAISIWQHMYIADVGNHRVRAINPAQVISTVAGNGASASAGDGGLATSASFMQTHDIATDSSEYVYVTDYVGGRIRKFLPGGSIATIAGTGVSGYSGDGGPATAANIYSPAGITIDKRQNLYFSDRGNNRIRKVNRYGIITTIAGDGTIGYSGDGGPSTAARVKTVSMFATDVNDNLYFTDMSDNRIRKIDTFGIITTIAGTGTAGFSGDWGPATAAMVNFPDGIAIDGCNNIYFNDASNNRVRKISTAGIVSTIAGTGVWGYTGDGGSSLLARVAPSKGLATDKYGNVYFTSSSSNYIRKITVVSNAPVFTGGATQSFSICMGAIKNIDTLLAITDLDTLQTVTWGPLMPPVHGVLTANYSAVTTGAAIMPSGLTYTPSAGYTGTDSFKVHAGDCGSLLDTTTVYVTVVPCGGALHTANTEQGQMSIYPNPATTTLTVENAWETGTITICNMPGEAVMYSECNERVTHLDVSQLAAGMYIVKVNGRVVRRFVKK